MSRPTAVVVGVGAEQGVGAAVCRRFAKEGYHVLVAGRTPAKIEQVVAHHRHRRRQRRGRRNRCDARGRSRRLVRSGHGARQRARSCRHRRLQRRHQPAHRLPRGHGAAVRGILAGRLLCAASSSGARRRAGSSPLGRGTVIFTGASGSLRGKPGFAQFAAAKAGLRMISQSMAREYGAAGRARRPRRDRRRHQRPSPAQPRGPDRRASAARTACSASTRSPRPIGRSIASRVRPGPRRSTCGRSRRRSDAIGRYGPPRPVQRIGRLDGGGVCPGALNDPAGRRWHAARADRWDNEPSRHAPSPRLERDRSGWKHRGFHPGT